MNKLPLSLPSPVNFWHCHGTDQQILVHFFGESLEDHLPIGIMCSKFTFSQITSTWLATVSQVNTPTLEHFQICLHFAKSSLQPVDSSYLPKSSPAQMSLFLKKVYIYIYIQSFLPQFNCQFSIRRSSLKNWRTLCQG